MNIHSERTTSYQKLQPNSRQRIQQLVRQIQYGKNLAPTMVSELLRISELGDLRVLMSMEPLKPILRQLVHIITKDGEESVFFSKSPVHKPREMKWLHQSVVEVIELDELKDLLDLGLSCGLRQDVKRYVMVRKPYAPSVYYDHNEGGFQKITDHEYSLTLDQVIPRESSQSTIPLENLHDPLLDKILTTCGSLSIHFNLSPFSTIIVPSALWKSKICPVQTETSRVVVMSQSRMAPFTLCSAMLGMLVFDGVRDKFLYCPHPITTLTLKHLVIRCRSKRIDLSNKYYEAYVKDQRYGLESDISLTPVPLSMTHGHKLEGTRYESLITADVGHFSVLKDVYFNASREANGKKLTLKICPRFTKARALIEKCAFCNWEHVHLEFVGLIPQSSRVLVTKVDTLQLTLTPLTIQGTSVAFEDFHVSKLGWIEIFQPRKLVVRGGYWFLRSADSLLSQVEELELQLENVREEILSRMKVPKLKILTLCLLNDYCQDLPQFTAPNVEILTLRFIKDAPTNLASVMDSFPSLSALTIITDHDALWTHTMPRCAFSHLKKLKICGPIAGDEFLSGLVLDSLEELSGDVWHPRAMKVINSAVAPNVKRLDLLINGARQELKDVHP